MRYLILLCVLFCFSFCGNSTRKLTKTVKANFTNRLEGSNTSLSSKIDIKGIYRSYFRSGFGSIRYNEGGKPDTSFNYILFYEDGSFLFNILKPEELESFNDYFRLVTDNGWPDYFYSEGTWGVYSISGDTIKAQYTMRAHKFTPWFTGETWYLIKNRRTLEVVYCGDLDKIDLANKAYYDKIDRDCVEYSSDVVFLPAESIPPPNNWLKRNRFFWRNESDWKEYMMKQGLPVK